MLQQQFLATKHHKIATLATFSHVWKHCFFLKRASFHFAAALRLKSEGRGRTTAFKGPQWSKIPKKWYFQKIEKNEKKPVVIYHPSKTSFRRIVFKYENTTF